MRFYICENSINMMMIMIFLDSSLERFDSSLHDNFSVELPINDPTGETFSTRYKREESGYLPKQGKEQHFCKLSTACSL